LIRYSDAYIPHFSSFSAFEIHIGQFQLWITLSRTVGCFFLHDKTLPMPPYLVSFCVVGFYSLFSFLFDILFNVGYRISPGRPSRTISLSHISISCLLVPLPKCNAGYFSNTCWRIIPRLESITKLGDLNQLCRNNNPNGKESVNFGSALIWRLERREFLKSILALAKETQVA